jgi:hypothetical protein
MYNLHNNQSDHLWLSLVTSEGRIDLPEVSVPSGSPTLLISGTNRTDAVSSDFHWSSLTHDTFEVCDDRPLFCPVVLVLLPMRMWAEENLVESPLSDAAPVSHHSDIPSIRSRSPYARQVLPIVESLSIHRSELGIH